MKKQILFATLICLSFVCVCNSNAQLYPNNAFYDSTGRVYYYAVDGKAYYYPEDVQRQYQKKPQTKTVRRTTKNSKAKLYPNNAYYDSTGKVYYYAEDGKAYYYPEDVQRQYQRKPQIKTVRRASSNQKTNAPQKQKAATNTVTISEKDKNILSADWWKTATLEQLKEEIKNGANVNAKGRDKAGINSDGDLRTNVTPLMFALKYGNPSLETVQALIDAGADVNAKEGVIGISVLMYAVDNITDLEIIEEILKRGANIEAKDRDGLTPLIRAAEQNANPAVIEVLLKHGADINAKYSFKNNDGDMVTDNTVLMPAAHNQNTQIIETLIKHGADVNAKNSKGGTPIMFAALGNQNPEVIKTLLKHGADINNVYVLALAQENSNKEVKNLVISEMEKSYNEADFEDRTDFDSRVSGCILKEEIQQDYRSSLSPVDQFQMMMTSALSVGLNDSQRTKECQCIFNAVQAYLGDAEYKKTMEAFNQGRQGTFKKTIKKATPVAFGVCF